MDVVDRYPHLQFRKHWHLSEAATNLLGQCEAFVAALTGMPLRPDLHEHLLNVSLKKGAQATTAIEGNTLTDEEVDRVASGIPLPPSKEYQETEVRNVLAAMNELLHEVVDQERVGLITVGLIKRLHVLIGKDLGVHLDAVPGQWRSDERVVGSYRCPAYADVPELADRLCEWLRSEFGFETAKQSFPSAVTQAIVTHVYLEWIHPFGDGNGRAGRLLEFYVLLRAGLPDIASHILSNFYNDTRPEYYRQIQVAQEKKDLSDFIEYAARGLRDGLRETLGRVQESLLETAWRSYSFEVFAGVKYRKTSVFKRRRDLALAMPIDTPRSADEMAFATPDLSRRYAGLSRDTLMRDLKEIEALGLIVRTEDDKFRTRTETIRRPRRLRP